MERSAGACLPRWMEKRDELIAMDCKVCSVDHCSVTGASRLDSGFRRNDGVGRLNS